MPAEPASLAPRTERLTVAVVAIAALAVQLPIFDRWLALLDEGYILALADEINRGKVLYRDVYVDAPFPGAFYLLAGWFRLAGTSVWASRLPIVAAFALMATLVYGIARALLPRGAALAAVALVLCYRIWAFPHWQIYSYSAMAATALTAAVALLLAHLGRRDRATVLGAGLCVGAGILCKQDYGTGVGGALGLFLLLRPFLEHPRPRLRAALAPAALFASGITLMVVPVLAAFAAAGALDDLVTQAVVLPLSGAINFPYTRLPSLSPLFAQDHALRSESGSYFPSILVTLRWAELTSSHLFRETAVWDVGLKAVYYAPIVIWATAAALWGGGALAHARRGGATATDARRLLLLAWAGGFLLAFNPPRDWVHLMMIYPPALVLGVSLVHGGLRRLPLLPRRVGATALVSALAALIVVSIGLGRDLRRQLDWPLRLPRGGVYTDASHGPILEEVADYVAREAPPGTPVPVFPTQTMLEFLTGREAAGGFHVIWPVQPPDRDARIIADLERRRVELVLYSLSQYWHIGTFRTNAPALYDHLVRHYEIARVFSQERWGPILCALRRRPEAAAPGTSLLEVVGRQDGVRRDAWPFAEVLAVPVGTPIAPAAVTVTVPVPAGRPRLTFAYGLNPARWLERPPGPFTFTIDAAGTRLFAADVDPTERLEDRRWVPTSVDLTPYADQTLILTVAVSAPNLPPDPATLAGLAEPRLLVQ